MFIAPLIRNAWNLLAPLDCALCQQLLPEQEPLPVCTTCRLLVDPPDPRCPFCAATVEVTPANGRCNHCSGESFRFDKILALGRYDGLLRQAVTLMKSPNHERIALLMAELLALRCQQELAANEPHVIVPAPMVWSHRLLRGVNSADLLALRIGTILGIKAPLDALHWQRTPQRQSSLAPRFRRKNVRNALAVSTSYDFTGCHVLFVDDVVTTAATAHEASRALRAAGAQSVTVAAVARGLGE